MHPESTAALGIHHPRFSPTATHPGRSRREVLRGGGPGWGKDTEAAARDAALRKQAAVVWGIHGGGKSVDGEGKTEATETAWGSRGGGGLQW
jgi:hypothetical protein